MQTQKSRSEPGLTAQMSPSMRLSSLFIVVVATLFAAQPLHAGQLRGPYTDSSYFKTVNFGQKSHWLQPWRGYLETMPASQFINGIGMCGPPAKDMNKRVYLKMLAKNGVRHIRWGVTWNQFSYENEDSLIHLGAHREMLRAFQSEGIRPTILLWCHSGIPCPMRIFNRTVTEAAPIGATSLTLNSTEGLIPDYSGISNLTDYWACEAFFTAIDGNKVTLSKPLPKAIDAGERKRMSTLKYRPFSPPGSKDYHATMAGWQRYVKNIVQFCRTELNTLGKDDPGFDLEIWNELTFGSRFRNIEWYYDPVPPELEHEEGYLISSSHPDGLVMRTVEVARQNPELFKGVRFLNSLSNTIPWPSAETQPDEVIAVGKHPYPGMDTKEFPTAGKWKNVQGKIDEWQPTYTVRAMPEYGATWLQGTIVWDMGPFKRRYWGSASLHGRYVRGKDKPCWVWITEHGTTPGDKHGITDTMTAHRLKGKFLTRAYTFFLNKGVQRYFPFSAGSGDLGFGTMLGTFKEYCRSNSVYPADDLPYTSPTLLWTRRIITKMKEGLDSSLTLENTRPISVEKISDTHNRSVFSGNTGDDGQRPNLYHRDVLSILPYQINATGFVIPYYVMTRDLLVDLTPEDFTVTLGGINGLGAGVAVYDPVSDSDVPFVKKTADNESITLTLSATDYPRLLLIDESGTTRLPRPHGSSPPSANPITASPVPGGLLIRGAGHGPVTVQVQDCRGRIIARKTGITEESVLLPTGPRAEGVYIVRITSTTTTIVRRFLLQ